MGILYHGALDKDEKLEIGCSKIYGGAGIGSRVRDFSWSIKSSTLWTEKIAALLRFLLIPLNEKNVSQNICEACEQRIPKVRTTPDSQKSS